MLVRKLPLFALAVALVVPVSLRAAVTIKLATQAPVNSSWHKALLDMGAEWDACVSGSHNGESVNRADRPFIVPIVS